MVKTGFSRLCINPPLGTPIVGYFKPRYTKGILDDIYVSVVAFGDGETAAVILAVDFCILSKTVCDTLRESVSRYTGIPFDAVFIICSHTHTAPAYGYDKLTNTPGCKEYDIFFEEQLCRAAKEAVSDLRESSFSIAENTVPGIAFIRRFRMKDGRVMTNPGINRDDIDCALGTPNETVKLIKVERENAEDLYIVNFAVHADVIGGEYISADFPGVMRSIVEGAVPNCKCIFLNGAEGDVNHTNPFPGDYEQNGYEHSKLMGRKIADAVLEIHTKTEKLNSDKLSYGTKTVTVAANAENDRIEEAKKIYELHTSGKDHLLSSEGMERTTAVAEAKRIISLYDGPESFDFDLAVLKFGDIAFAGVPGEPFAEIGRRIEKESPFKVTVVCCLTNSGDSYFPTSSAYDEGGYEARSSLLKKGVDNILVDGFKSLLTDDNDSH